MCVVQRRAAAAQGRRYLKLERVCPSVRTLDIEVVAQYNATNF